MVVDIAVPVVIAVCVGISGCVHIDVGREW